jgi:serine/threonine protein kinase/regulator of sirC expression with transglutaminase-like and TPR domain
MSDEPIDEKAVFNGARVMAAHQERMAFLQGACAGNAEALQRILNLLRVYDQEESFLESPPIAPDATMDTPAAERPGAMIGPYRLLQQIGEGGMGTVYMAEQTQPVRRVALKVIKPGMDSGQVVARFEAERQALALMDHANIARVFDGGATDNGRPYFVMELVHGIPITRYCDDNHLTPRERLELFVAVCQAIQHAHQKGIIHRDIKPSNVLVALYDGKPVPKVIDFGVAKATEQRLTDHTLFTQYGTMVGTLEYMSPEQAEMSALGVDTRSDIYSLGVLLYELLTGSTPLTHQRLKEAGYAEILRIIKEEEPQRPSARLSDSGEALASISANRHMEPAKLTKLVRGELDWIVMKCLEKDRNRRYETANGFAQDVNRYLHDEPVLACPPSALYRFRKFARRNKGPFAATLAAVVVILLALVGLALSNVLITRERNEKTQALEQAQINEREAKEQRQEAEENLRQALAAVHQMLTRVGAETLYSVPGMEPVRRQLLEDALRFYQSFLARKHNDPRIRREVALTYLHLGTIHRDLGQTAESEADYRKAFALVDALAADGPVDPDFRAKLISGHIGCAQTMLLLGKAEDKGKHTRIAVTMGEELVKEFPDKAEYAAELAFANRQLANEVSRRDPGQAEEILRRNLMITRSPWEHRKTYTALGRLAFSQGRYADAEQAYREAVKLGDAAAAERPWDLAEQRHRSDALHGLARAVAASGRLAEASEIFGQSTAIMDVLVADHPQILEWREILALTLRHHAQVLEQLDRPVEAETAYSKSFAHSMGVVGREPNVGQYQEGAWYGGSLLGRFLLKLGRIEDAQEIYAQAATFLEKHPADAPTRLKLWKELFHTTLDLGHELAKMGNPEKSEAAFEQALAIQDRLKNEFSADDGHLLQLGEGLADAGRQFRKAGKAPEANRFARRTLELLATAEPMPDVWEAWHRRGVIYANLGQWDRALADQTKALELRPESFQTLWRRGEAYLGLKQWDRAVADCSKAIELDPDKPAAWHFRGYAYANLGQQDRALADLTRAIELGAVNWTVWSRRGDVYRTLKQWDQALADYARAIEMGAPDGSVWVAKAAAHAQLDLADQAMADLPQAITRGFRNAALLKKLDDLAPLRSRDDFKRLVAELEAMQKQSVAPPPK